MYCDDPKLKGIMKNPMKQYYKKEFLSLFWSVLPRLLPGFLRTMGTGRASVSSTVFNRREDVAAVCTQACGRLFNLILFYIHCK